MYSLVNKVLSLHPLSGFLGIKKTEAFEEVKNEQSPVFDEQESFDSAKGVGPLRSMSSEESDD